MKFVDEYRDATLIHRLVEEIERLSQERSFKFMEVCGGHTHTIYKHGIEDILPGNIDLVHGPGCPVCVLPMGRIDDAIAIARTDGVIFTTFGDMMRVPGSQGSLLDARANGADVRFVYSPLDALKLARQHPDRQVVFFAIGFETTAPSTAITLLRAQAENIQNFSIFCNHVNIIPAIKAILDSPDFRIDGFIGPGHVSMVIGMRPYTFIARDRARPMVISGFEPLDIVQSVYMLVKQISEGRAEIENQYARVVRPRRQCQSTTSNGSYNGTPSLLRVAWHGLHHPQRTQATSRVRLLGCRATLQRPWPACRRPESLSVWRSAQRRNQTLAV